MASRAPVRWEVEWQELTPAARLRHTAEQAGGPSYEHDRDRDEQTFAKAFKTQEKARAYASSMVSSGRTVYGAAIVQEQHYLPIEGTPYRDWENIGEPEYVED